MSEKLWLNGISGLTGEYLTPPMSIAEAAGAARGEPQACGWTALLRRLFRPILGRRAVISGRVERFKALEQLIQDLSQIFQAKFYSFDRLIDLKDPMQAGWGVVFPRNATQAVRDAVGPLIRHRAERFGKGVCKELEYRPGEDWKQWLLRYKVTPGSPIPTLVPYYLLLVGGPSDIPFEFQELLDIDYAVGRVAFEHPEEYARYAQSVVDYEKAETVRNAREIAFWGTRHAEDRATKLSDEYLIGPLCLGQKELGQAPIAEALGFGSQCFRGPKATKTVLHDLLHPLSGEAGPAVLMTASHGVGMPLDHADQRRTNGALLCQNWEGFGAVRREDYFSAEDVDERARVHGLVAFHFACYGAGTPEYDHYLSAEVDGNAEQAPLRIAPAPFVAALPQRLLSHPGGGALAVIGHVERAWGCSFFAPRLGGRLNHLRNMLAGLLAGEPVGHVTADISKKYAESAADLLQRIDPHLPGAKQPTNEELAQTWVECNDARNYVVLGDPAVRLRVEALKRL